MQTDQPAYQMFYAEERAFLERMFVDHPTIGVRFDEFLAMDPADRHGHAIDFLKKTPRHGWVKRQVKDPESVFDHVEELAAMTREMNLPADLQGRSKGDMRKRLTSMALVHDIPEAIVSDFTPTCPITPHDKDLLERLAGRVIFQSTPHAQELIEEYAAQETPLSHLLHDFDKLAAVFKALEYEGIYPQMRGKLYEGFRDYAVPRLKTEHGREHAQSIERDAETICQAARQRHLQQKFGGMRF